MSVNFSSLTTKQRKVYSAIETYIKTKGIPPTVREIGEMVGEKTPGAVQGILNRLEQKGAIKRQLGAARSIQLTSEDNLLYANPVYIPEIKKISKRNVDDILNIYNIEKYHPVSPDFLAGDGNYIIMDCPDNGLAESGFQPDDTLIVNLGSELNPGDVALVFYEARAMLRYYYPGEDDATVILKSDSSIIEKERFAYNEVKILGKVISRYTRLSF